MAEECERRGLRYHTVRPLYSTDNAAMIGIVGWHKMIRGSFAPLTVTARASMIRAAREGGFTGGEQAPVASGEEKP